MKKLMIVDDEALVRMGLKSLVKWEEHNYQIAGEASNGKEALEKIPQIMPDIILTDLKMTPVDGFELISRCRVLYPGISFVVLSNYNDLDNVKRAMKLGAVDYIFKLTVKSDELLAILDDINCAGAEGVSESGLVKDNLTETKTGMMIKLLDTDNAFDFSVSKILSSIPLTINIQEPVTVTVLRIDNYKVIRNRGDFPQRDLLYFAVDNIMTEVLNKTAPSDIFQYLNGNFVAVINETDKEKLGRVLQLLAANIERAIGINVSMAMATVDNIEMLGNKVNEAFEILRSHFYKSGHCIYSDKERLPENYGKIHLTDLVECLKRADYLGAVDSVSAELKAIDADRNTPSDVVCKVFGKIDSIFSMYPYKGENIFESICDSNGVSFSKAAESYVYWDDIYTNTSYALGLLRKKIQGEKIQIVRPEILKIQKYVDDNLGEGISVPMAAKMINMSESGFAHMFKKEVGISFGEYLLRERMVRAARMLNETDYTVGEISDMVGCDNPNYFSTMFKKFYGIPPVEYKKSGNSRI